MTMAPTTLFALLSALRTVRFGTAPTTLNRLSAKGLTSALDAEGSRSTLCTVERGVRVISVFDEVGVVSLGDGHTWTEALDAALALLEWESREALGAAKVQVRVH